MWPVNYFSVTIVIYCLSMTGTLAFNGYVTLTHDGPTVQGGTITFRADIFNRDGSKTVGTFDYIWRDSAVPRHMQETKSTKNSTNTWSVQYPAALYPVGEYSVEVLIDIHHFLWDSETSQHTTFQITHFLNGNMSINQSHHLINDNYVSSAMETNMIIDLRRGDADFILTNATEISTFWFVDCKYYGQTNDFTFHYNFTKPNTNASVEALIVASYDIPPTTPPPTTTSPPIPSNTTTASLNISTTLAPPTITKSSILVKPSVQKNNNFSDIGIDARNMSFPFVCLNSTVVPPDPKKTYGYFQKTVEVRAPIHNITVEGTNWIKPWDLLSLNVSCHGSGPFHKCLEYHRGNYNLTGNETCENGEILHSCNFSINHYFLDPTVYTILTILKNDVSTLVYPLTINIYEVTAKPQLSVIVVPVSCSLAAVVLIVFGIAYYIQNRARFTVEVADFDFGQNNPEMEYKTFTERLRDSFNNTVSLGNKKMYIRPPSYGSMNY